MRGDVACSMLAHDPRWSSESAVSLRSAIEKPQPCRPAMNSFTRRSRSDGSEEENSLWHFPLKASLQPRTTLVRPLLSRKTDDHIPCGSEKLMT
jgi:hypothetical protein